MSGTDATARLFADALIPLPPIGWHTRRMNAPSDLSQLSPDQLRHLAATLMSQVEEKEQALRHSEQVNQKLTYELALLKRHAFGKRSEQLNVLQISLLDEVVDADIAAIEAELEALNPTPTAPAARKTPSAPPCRPSCRAPRSAMSRKTPTVLVAANGGGSAKRSARSSTTRRACSTSSAISVASGSATSARR